MIGVRGMLLTFRIFAENFATEVHQSAAYMLEPTLFRWLAEHKRKKEDDSLKNLNLKIL
jgi:hypothetical protein